MSEKGRILKIAGAGLSLRQAQDPGLVEGQAMDRVVGTAPTVRWRSVFVLAGLLLAAASASAQYKSIGPDGRVTYSDQPPPKTARVVEQKKLGGGAKAPAPQGISAT